MNRIFVVALALISIALISAGCQGVRPLSRSHLVVHVLSDSCEPDFSQAPILRRMASSGDRDAVVRFDLLEPHSRCGRPFAGTPTDAKYLQAWITPGRRALPNPAWVQAGPSEAPERRFAVSGMSLRIDHRHVWIGTLDITEDPPRWVPPADIRHAAEKLAHRQACERTFLGADNDSCGTQWQYADLLGFNVVPSQPDTPG